MVNGFSALLLKIVGGERDDDRKCYTEGVGVVLNEGVRKNLVGPVGLEPTTKGL